MSIFIRWFSVEHRAFASSLLMLGGASGLFTINLLFPVIVNRFDTWRWPFIIFGVVGIVFALGLAIWGKDTGHGNTQSQSRLAVLRDIFQNKQIWFCFGLQFVRVGTIQGITFWLPTYLINEKLFSIQLVGVILALQGLASAVAGILGGYLVGKFKKPTLVICVSMVMLGITTALMIPVTSTVLLFAVIVINSLFFQAYFGPLFNMAIEILGPEKTGLSNGASNMFAMLGGLATTYLMGILRDNTGSFEWGFYTICILCVMGLALSIAFASVRQKKNITRL
jgi:nitrate/nitrite transporter NarK